MLKLQEKLFFRCIMRTVLLLLWFGGSMGYYMYLQSQLQKNDILVWNAADSFFLQLRACYFFFVMMALLAFDYFREVPDATLLETVRTTGRCIKNDCTQFFVLLQFVLLSGILIFIFQISYFKTQNALTSQILKYLGKISILYIGLNGIIAILLGWLLSRRVNKIMGYVCLLLFCILVSPNMVINFNYLIISGIRATKFFKEFYIMPEIVMVDEMVIGNYVTLIPIHFSHLCRGLFWLFLFMAAIAGCYPSKKMRIAGAVFICMTAGSFCGMLRPASYSSMNDSYDEADAAHYPYVYYITQKHEQKEKEVSYVFLDYDIDIQLGQQMKVNAVMKPSEKKSDTYDMTLYHLYKIEHITDQDGKELPYEREGDYLTIYNASKSLEEIVMTYQGGCANFYSNKEELYLPACFPYYPVPGFRIVYDTEEQMYADNRLDTEADFDITFFSASKIYSDLPEISENHFVGKSRGVLFVSGFFEEEVLEGGTVCIYPYLDQSANPCISKNKTIYPLVLEYMIKSGIWENLENKKCIFTPGITGDNFAYITENTLAAPAYSWEALESECEKNNILSWYYGEEEDENTLSEIELVDIYKYRYYFLRKEAPEEITYNNLKQKYMREFAEYLSQECTDEMFDQFFIENFGEEELESLKGER